MAKTCDVCNSPSGMYPICRACFKLRDEGKVIKCEDCGKWHYSNKTCTCNPSYEFAKTISNKVIQCDKCGKWNYDYKPCKCNLEKKNTYSIPKTEPTASQYSSKPQYFTDKLKEENTHTTTYTTNCIVCGSSSDNKLQCKECYSETKDYISESDKNKQISDFNDYYFNLKNSMFRMRDIEIVKRNCNKLMAIAISTNKYHNNSTLMNRIQDDIVKTIASKTIEETTPPKIILQDEQKEEIIRTLDGHRVKSDAEKTIDDMLYQARILHSYEQRVKMTQEERAISADWFIPVLGSNGGIYIEYWGMTTKTYLKNKEEKKALYIKYNIPLIEIEKDEVKGDSQALNDRIYQEINSLAKEHFRITNFLKS